MLLHCASVNHRYDILFGKFSENLATGLLALKENLPWVICTNYYNAEIGSVKVNVDIEQEIFRDSWDADWRPSLTILHRRVRIYVIQKDSDILRFHISYLIGVCEHTDHIQGGYQHAATNKISYLRSLTQKLMVCLRQ